MSKKKTSRKTMTPKQSPGVNPDRPFPPPPDPEPDLEKWRCLMLDVYLSDVASEAERRHVNMHVNLTAQLARELRAVRRAIECRGGVK